jgi:hypothetical protein
MFTTSISSDRSRAFEISGEIRNDDLRGTTSSSAPGCASRWATIRARGANPRRPRPAHGRQPEAHRRRADQRTVQQERAGHHLRPRITSQPTNTLFYVDNTAGEGSYDDPTTLGDATTRPGPNQFIVLTDNDGWHGAWRRTVHSGQSLSRRPHLLRRGRQLRALFTHTLRARHGDITLDVPGGGTGLTLESQTNIYGFGIHRSFSNAIYGHNINNVVIDAITIDGAGTA